MGKGYQKRFQLYLKTFLDKKNLEFLCVDLWVIQAWLYLWVVNRVVTPADMNYS